jgi:hypothetical protein
VTDPQLMTHRLETLHEDVSEVKSALKELAAAITLRVQLWAQALLVTGLAYLVAKAMLGRASSEALYEAAKAGSTGAGVAYLGVCLLRALVLVGLLLFFAQVQR